MTESSAAKFLHGAVTIAMWIVAGSAFLGSFLPFLTRAPILIMFCKSCGGPFATASMLFERGGLSILIILVLGSVALWIWHAASWPYVILGPLLLAGTIAGADRGTFYDWFWWLWP